MTRTRIEFGLFAVLLALVSPSALALQAENRDTSVQEYRNPFAQDPLVKLWVTAVSHDKRRLVLHLDRDDFRVLEGNQTQRVEYFSSDSSDRFKLGLLIDVSLAENEALRPELWSAVSRFFGELLLKGDQAFVATFADEASVLQDWTNDRHLLDQAAQKAFGATPKDQTALYDAIAWACEERLCGSAQRKILIVVASADDNSSYHTLEETKEATQRSDTIVYWVTPWSGSTGDPFPGIQTAKQFTTSTGGIAYTAASPKEFGAAFHRIAFVLSNLYTFGYHPRDQARDGKFHKITIQCTKPGIRLFTREGYYSANR